MQPSDDLADKLIETFGVRVDLTEDVGVKGLPPGGRVYRVKGFPRNCEVYILDCEAGRRIACHPHIVGERLAGLALSCARDAVRAVIELTSLSEYDEAAIVFEHVLRAAPGYRLHEALREVGVGFREVWIRPRYVTPSYRAHHAADERRIEVVYEDFSELPRRELLMVLKPDTEASGRTGKASLERLAEAAEEKNSTLEELVVYGFISIDGLKTIYETASSLGFKRTYFLAIGNLTALCHNLYDMPLYGPDESYYSEKREMRLLGGITDYETFTRFLPEYIPGADQPGDWSARQTTLYTGYDYEPGGIEKHLTNSINLIERLWSILKNQEWFTEIHEEAIRRELENLRSVLASYREQKK
jgi:hypothetical protein